MKIWGRRIVFALLAILTLLLALSALVFFSTVTWHDIGKWVLTSGSFIVFVWGIGVVMVKWVMKEIATQRAVRAEEEAAVAKLSADQLEQAATARQRINEVVEQTALSMTHVVQQLNATTRKVDDLHETLHTNGGGALLQQFSDLLAQFGDLSDNVLIAFHQQLATIPVATMSARINRDGIVDDLAVSESYTQLTGLTSDRAANRAWIATVVPEHVQNVTTVIDRALLHKTPFEVAYTSQHVDTKKRTEVRMFGVPLRDATGRVYGWAVQVFPVIDPSVHQHRRASDLADAA